MAAFVDISHRSGVEALSLHSAEVFENLVTVTKQEALAKSHDVFDSFVLIPLLRFRARHPHT